MRKSTSTPRPPRGATRFPGIIEDARTLGVNRVTLYRVLSGHPGFQHLKTLRQRYDQLQRDKEAS